ncbi:hypothetical protein SAMN05660826_02346 [Caldanaerovirga acetigignens]|uniref:Uncharacterized protein n=1 Tax=Caldanaerovirga acetigignens TaxID=447595 RepID=A0A1M7MM58_9FIRM|nr:hypothetical protein SAMN05660826_02346 [Caldanaerovirga acetigignens]
MSYSPLKLISILILILSLWEWFGRNLTVILSAIEYATKWL